MARFLIKLLVAIGLSVVASCATTASRGASQADLDSMFQRLRTTHDPAEAQMLEVAIRHVWSHSGRAGVDELMHHAATDIHDGDYDEALATLNDVISDDPEFAEGWNLRATVHFLRDEYPEAIADIHHVLTLEPRHFGALVGLGYVMLAMDEKRAALHAFEAALAINPHLDDVRDEADSLEDEVAGIPI